MGFWQSVRKFFTACMDPVYLVLACLLAAFLLLCVYRHHVSTAWLIGISFFILLLCSISWLPNYLLFHLEQRYLPVLQPDPVVHWIVVLGGSYVANPALPQSGQLTSVSLLRLIEAIRLYKANLKSTLVLSGGGVGRKDMPEAERRREVAVMLGIPESAMVVLPASFNTYQEAVRTQAIIQHAPFYLVTSAAHMRRAMALFQHQGMHPIAAPTNFLVKSIRIDSWRDFMPSSGNVTKFAIYWHEAIGTYWGKWRGHIT